MWQIARTPFRFRRISAASSIFAAFSRALGDQARFLGPKRGKPPFSTAAHPGGAPPSRRADLIEKIKDPLVEIPGLTRQRVRRLLQFARGLFRLRRDGTDRLDAMCHLV